MDRHLPAREPRLQQLLARLYSLSSACGVHIEHLQPFHDNAKLHYL
jgi:hypothetical protein